MSWKHSSKLERFYDRMDRANVSRAKRMSKKLGDSRQIQLFFGKASALFSIALMSVGYVLLMMFSLFAARYAERNWQLDKSDTAAIFTITFFVLALVLFFAFLIRKAKRDHLAAQKNDTER